MKQEKNFKRNCQTGNENRNCMNGKKHQIMQTKASLENRT